jgi:hypothetical protein
LKKPLNILVSALLQKSDVKICSAVFMQAFVNHSFEKILSTQKEVFKAVKTAVKAVQRPLKAQKPLKAQTPQVHTVYHFTAKRSVLLL